MTSNGRREYRGVSVERFDRAAAVR
jgi:hypothetical protein